METQFIETQKPHRKLFGNFRKLSFYNTLFLLNIQKMTKETFRKLSMKPSFARKVSFLPPVGGGNWKLWDEKRGSFERFKTGMGNDTQDRVLPAGRGPVQDHTRRTDSRLNQRAENPMKYQWNQQSVFDDYMAEWQAYVNAGGNYHSVVGISSESAFQVTTHTPGNYVDWSFLFHNKTWCQTVLADYLEELHGITKIKG